MKASIFVINVRRKKMSTTDMEGNKKVINDTFWLDGWNGKCKSGFFYRNNIGVSIKDFEEKFKRKVVGITLDREGWNVEFILEEQEDE